ncbi:ATP synthase subunit I [Caenibacillus caldisaponilyticus]|uniref:ATP synthase subunit I n=1 Tax=Caenibacillus caldisaponilyticus TaxID=1674942 RepID=UPI0009886AE7|nr:ATP synthase subunit I [Caenibacillus caldisaponilyticus]
MDEWAWYRRFILILSCAFYGASLLLWLFTPLKSFAAGFILGGLISLYNILYLARRVRIIHEQAAWAVPRRAGSGFVNRVLMVAFGVILAYRFPEQIDYRGLAPGLALGYILMVIAACRYNKKERLPREGREILGNHSEN